MSYNRDEVAKGFISGIASKLYAVKLITEAQFVKIRTDFKCGFYTPSFFVRIGLFVFTMILINAAIGIAGMVIVDFIREEITLGIALIVASAVCFYLLESFIKRKHHYRSGIDDCLLYASLLFLIAGIVLIFQNYDLLPICFMALPVLLIAFWRYADSFVALIAMICFYTIVFLILKDYETGRLWMPFIFGVISFVLIASLAALLKNDELFYYERSFQVLKTGALLALYASLNYFVVSETNKLLNEGATVVPFQYVFIAATLAVPVVYIITGLKQKDRMLLWTGLGVLLLSVLTLKYRYQSIDYKYLMTFLGAGFLLVSWRAIKYLKNNTSGFTFVPDASESGQDLLNAEAIVISQTLSHQQSVPPQGTEFGGGSFGGGGAGGNL